MSTPQPPIRLRSQWGATRKIPAGRTVPLSQRRYFVVHWPVMSARPNDQWARDIERMHLNQGWALIGYNFLVFPDGQILEGAGLMNRGIHSPPRNTDGWGCVCCQPSTAAGVPTQPITDAMKRSARALYDWLCSQAGRRLIMSWHGADFATACPGPDLRSWVQSGMPAPGGPPPPEPKPPAQEEDIELVTSALAQNGTLHVWMVGPQRKTIWLTHQAANTASWWGGQAGRGPAGFRRFADAPAGRTFRGVSATLSKGGALHLFATLDNGVTMYSWQRPNESTWQNLQVFAPMP